MQINLKNLLSFSSILLCGGTSASLAMELPNKEDPVELTITRRSPLLKFCLPANTEIHINGVDQVWVKTAQQNYPATPWQEYALANKLNFRVNVRQGNSDSIELLIPRGSKAFSFFEGSEVAVNAVSAWVKEKNGPGYYATPFDKFAEKLGLPTLKATLVDVRPQAPLMLRPRDIENFIRSAYDLHHRLRPLFESMESCAMSFAFAQQPYPPFEELEREVEKSLKTSTSPHVPDSVIDLAAKSVRAHINKAKQQWLEFDQKFQNYKVMKPEKLHELDMQGIFRGFSDQISDYIKLLPKTPSLKEFASSLLQVALPSVALEEIFPAYGSPKPKGGAQKEDMEKPVAPPMPKKDPIKHKIIDEVQEAWDAVINEKDPRKKDESVMAIGMNVATKHVPPIRGHLQNLIAREPRFNLKDIETLKTFLGNDLDPRIQRALKNASQVKDDILIRPNMMTPGLNPRHFLLETASLVNNIVSQQKDDPNAQFLKVLLSARLEEQDRACNTGLVGRTFSVYIECFKYLVQQDENAPK